ncbi:MAG: helix-turn-helix domain-containing protein, partial [Anaerolineae bacterium]|nr:helix-turn-helix domain-containing protein [Anaerolineae bacterium]
MNAEALGQLLRAAREDRELTLEDAERALRIRVRFLEAFETGAYQNLPGLVQARGFLRNYARFLGLDQDAILAQFDIIQQAATGRGRWPVRAQAAQPAVPVEPALGDSLAPPQASRGRRFLITLGGLIGLVALIAGCWLTTQLVETVLNEDAAAAGPDLVTLLPTAPSLTPSATFEPSATPSGGVVVAAGPLITDRVVLRLSVVQRAWLRVIADG